jgi:hypothetical protein
MGRKLRIRIDHNTCGGELSRERNYGRGCRDRRTTISLAQRSPASDPIEAREHRRTAPHRSKPTQWCGSDPL